MIHKRKITGVIFTLALITMVSQQLWSKPRILIIYFTWAENTVVTNRAKAVQEANKHISSMERKNMPDTVTSASVLPPGNTAKLASWIHSRVGGDIYSIKVNDKYPSYYSECLDRAWKEKSAKTSVQLINNNININNYDIIFMGFPNWWSSIPMPVKTFVESKNFSNKKIIPFVSHGTGGIAATVRDLKKLLPKSAIVERPIGIYRSDTNNARGDINNWLQKLGY